MFPRSPLNFHLIHDVQELRACYEKKQLCRPIGDVTWTGSHTTPSTTPIPWLALSIPRLTLSTLGFRTKGPYTSPFESWWMVRAYFEQSINYYNCETDMTFLLRVRAKAQYERRNADKAATFPSDDVVNTRNIRLAAIVPRSATGLFPKRKFTNDH